MFRLITFLSAMGLIFLIARAWFLEGRSDWKQVQRKEFSREEGSAGRTEGILEVELPGLGRTDRCITCHRYMEDPAASSWPEPYRAHPGEILANHPVQDYGCTICHGGQGRAVSRKEAHGTGSGAHWSVPLLGEPYIQSSCGKCHSTVFTDTSRLAGMDTFTRGLVIFRREGCLGCHKARGVGGSVGPDLTRQGEKNRIEYSFRYVSGERTVSNWLIEHFRDPVTVSPGSRMLGLDLPDDEMEALVTFVKGLARPDISFSYISPGALSEFKGIRDDLPGDRIFDMCCSACHGRDGQGKDYDDFQYGVPSIGNPDFLSVASEDYIRFTLLRGRGRRMMASWDPPSSGLNEREIDALVRAILPDRGEVTADGVLAAGPGSPERGRALFEGNCSMCHGKGGAGGLAPALDNRDFLGPASDSFIAATLVRGRKNTAMPSWARLGKQDLADLLALAGSWRSTPYRPYNPEIQEGNAENGKVRFHYLCSRCHGNYGEGGTGPAILNRDFLAVVPTDFLYRTITRGRSHTAMFGWSGPLAGKDSLTSAGVGDILAFMKGMAGTRPDYILSGSNPGSPDAGREIFNGHCAECHGAEGRGDAAPALHNQEFLNASSNGYLLATVSLGRRGTRMPSWGRGDRDHPALTGKQRQEVVAWIRSWQHAKIRNE